MGRMSKADIIEMVVGDNVLAVEQSVRDYVASLGGSGGPEREAYAQIAYQLARKLDRDPGMAMAAVSKELRDTLAHLAESSGEDPFERWQAAFGQARGTSGRP